MALLLTFLLTLEKKLYSEIIAGKWISRVEHKKIKLTYCFVYESWNPAGTLKIFEKSVVKINLDTNFYRYDNSKSYQIRKNMFDQE